MLDDDEARYLISQYNAYASWNVGAWLTIFPYWALLLAAGALALSVVFQTDSAVFQKHPIDWIMGLSAFVLFIVMSVASVWVLVKDSKQSDAFHERLVMLENHRSRYKSLPDALTFENIISLKKLKTADLRTLLEESGKEIARHGRL